MAATMDDDNDGSGCKVPEERCICVDWLRCATAAKSSAPLAVVEHDSTRYACVNVDTMCIVSSAISVRAFANTLLTAWIRQCNAIIHSVMNKVHATLATVSCSHFHPLLLPHAITRVIINTDDDDDDDGDDEQQKQKQEERVRLHRALLLPPDRPLFRARNILRWTVDGRTLQRPVFPGKLHAIHVHLKAGASGVKDGVMHCVDGDYLYCHYMQDRFNDKGWGCAYRTFQTICSWYILNGYVDASVASVPKHGDIQRALVELGDKTREFQDSREWIGAVELSLVLKRHLNMTAKVLFVSRGVDIPQHARALAHHFDTQGSPVMIGGGQLSYGLLGVDYNPKSGDVKFLILDPHYTGAEDVNAILRDGWCGWKGADLFIPNTFYNFCLPQRPSEP